VISTVTIESRAQETRRYRRARARARAPAVCPLNRVLARVSGHVEGGGLLGEVKGREQRISGRVEESEET
jgi:hypothetical protein